MKIAGREIKRIVASGCSFTYGDGLENPKEQAWPAQLAKSLGVDCVNLAQPGMGNEHVFASIVDYFAFFPEHKKDSFVIPSFSKFSRIEFPVPGKYNYIKRAWATILNSRFEPEFTKLFFEKFYVDEYYYSRYMRIIISLQAILKMWDIKYLMFEGLSESFHKKMITNPEIKKLVEQIDRTKWFMFMTGNFDNLTDHNQRLPDGHPNAIAHAEMAEILYQHIINKLGADDGTRND